MTKCELPDYETIKKKNEEISKKDKWILDPGQEHIKEKKHILDWGRDKMRAYERFFKVDMPHNYTFATGSIDHEEVDVAEIYRKFPNAQLNWRIFKNRNLFSIVLKADRKILFKVDFAKV